MFFDVAVPAEDLLAIGGVGVALVGEIAFDHRRHQAHVIFGLLAHLLIGRHQQEIAIDRGPERKRPRRFVERLGVHQHAADVGVDDDRIGRAVRILRAGDGAALQPIFRVGDAVLIGHFRLAEPLQANAKARHVHHREHGHEALVLLADEIADSVVVVEHARRVAVDAHLLFDLAADDAIAFAERAIVLDQEFRHNEERNALGALRRTFDAREHQMDDVVREIVLTGGDENLLAGDAIGAVSLRDRLAAQHAKIGAAMRLRQVHGAGPLAGDQLR